MCCARDENAKRDSHSPFAVAEVGTRESFVEGLLVRLKVQDSDQCFLLQTVRAVLEPVGKVSQYTCKKKSMCLGLLCTL